MIKYLRYYIVITMTICSFCITSSKSYSMHCIKRFSNNGSHNLKLQKHYIQKRFNSETNFNFLDDNWNKGYIPTRHDNTSKNIEKTELNKITESFYDKKRSLNYIVRSFPDKMEKGFNEKPDYEDEDMVVFYPKSDKKVINNTPLPVEDNDDVVSFSLPSYDYQPKQIYPENKDLKESFYQRAIIVDKEIVLNSFDGRVKVDSPYNFPWSVHGYMDIVYKNRIYQGSGILVNSRHVLTAGHCIFTKEDGLPEKIIFYPGRNGSNFKWVSKATTLLLHPNWHKNEEEGSDLGMLILEKDIGLETGWAALKKFEDNELRDLNVHVTGYPSDKTTLEGFPYMYTMEGPIKTTKLHKFYYHIDTHGGQSGSGVWLDSKESIIDCCGIHVTGSQEEGNGAVRITEEKLKKIKKWVSSTDVKKE